jgi:hypothetical protein
MRMRESVSMLRAVLEEVAGATVTANVAFAGKIGHLLEAVGPERQAIYFHELQGVDVVLVPFDHLAVGHRRWFDRHQFVQAIMCQHKTARVLRQMPWRPYQLAGENDREF